MKIYKLLLSGVFITVSIVICLNIGKQLIKDSVFTEFLMWIELFVLFSLPLIALIFLHIFIKVPIKKYPELLIMCLFLLIKPIIILIFLITTSLLEYNVTQQIDFGFDIVWYYDIFAPLVIITLFIIYCLRVRANEQMKSTKGRIS